MAKLSEVLSTVSKLLSNSGILASEAPIAAATARIGLGLMHSYLSGVVPEKVDQAIQGKIQKNLEDLEGDCAKLLAKVTLVASLLAGLSVISCLANYFIHSSPWINWLLVGIVYITPLLMIAFAIGGLIFGITRIVSLESEIKKSIEQGIHEAGVLQSALVGVYENRSVEQLAETAAGKAVFSILADVRKSRKTWIYPLVCLSISYLCILGCILEPVFGVRVP